MSTKTTNHVLLIEGRSEQGTRKMTRKKRGGRRSGGLRKGRERRGGGKSHRGQGGSTTRNVNVARGQGSPVRSRRLALLVISVHRAGRAVCLKVKQEGSRYGQRWRNWQQHLHRERPHNHLPPMLLPKFPPSPRKPGSYAIRTIIMKTGTSRSSSRTLYSR